MPVEAAIVEAIARDIIEKLGAYSEVARAVSRSLIASDRHGAHTHGLSLLPLYANLVKDGIISPDATPSSEDVSRTLAKVDGHGAFGQITASYAVDLGLNLLVDSGISAVAIRDGTHLGRLGEWAEKACARGAIFLAYTNTAGGALNVAGPLSPERVLSTNPLAIGIPSLGGLQHDVIIDFAASQVSGSRIRETANGGGRLDLDWVINTAGEETDDPEAFLSGAAALRPLGGRSAGHKGFGLMVAAELLGALAGGLMAGERDTSGFSNGALFCFVDIHRWVDAQEWSERVRQFSEYLKTKGCRLPGSKHKSDGEHLDIPAHTLSSLLALADQYDVSRRGLVGNTEAPTVIKTW